LSRRRAGAHQQRRKHRDNQHNSTGLYDTHEHLLSSPRIEKGRVVADEVVLGLHSRNRREAGVHQCRQVVSGIRDFGHDIVQDGSK
jgi:hypothetical protein